MRKNGPKNAESKSPRPAVEWVVGAVSGIAVTVLVAFLIHQALFRQARAPDLSVVVEAVEQTRNGTLVTVAVRNSGDKAAAAVTVRAVGANDIGGREIGFDYVGGHAVRRGAFVFSQARIEPSELDVEIGGFVEP